MDRPKVGVGVIVVKDNKVLLGKRKNALGEGTWCFPGGHLEHGETWEDCAARETAEETGISITDLQFATATNDIFTNEQKHYITLYILAEHKDGIPEVKEPDKCEEWKWFNWNELPEPLFLPILNLIKQGYNPFSKNI